MNKLKITLPQDRSNYYWLTKLDEHYDGSLGRRLVKSRIETSNIPANSKILTETLNKPDDWTFNFQITSNGNSTTTLHAKSKTPNSPYNRIIKQELINLDDSQFKQTTIINRFNNHKVEALEYLWEDGHYICKTYRSGNGISSYTINPKVRNFASGIKGQLQKTALKISSDSNGCERPILKYLGELIFNLSKKIK